MKVRISQYIPVTRAEGPGIRACIQVQGCSVQCPGCAVPHTWATLGGKLIDCESLVAQILDEPLIEGVTFLGGEPFDQAFELAKIARLIKQEELSVVTFTGYLREELEKAKRQDYNELLAVTDLLIDGPFQRENVNFSRPWVGSTNQRYHFLTARYRYLEPILESIPNRVEVRIKSDGRILINGLAKIEDINALIQNAT